MKTRRNARGIVLTLAVGHRVQNTSMRVPIRYTFLGSVIHGLFYLNTKGNKGVRGGVPTARGHGLYLY